MTGDGIGADLGRTMLERMWLIRAFEEKASEYYARGWIRGLLHLSIGQEAVAVGTCSVLTPAEVVVSGHRPHGHLLAKGGDPRRVMAELAGRETGYCAGKGGTMHLSAPDVGFLTATGVVGGNIPLALGAALTSLVRKDGRACAVFFGDGAGQSGAFHESLNLAALWQLPVVFVCENNGYAEFSALDEHTVVERLASYASVYSIPAVTIDGNDVEAVRDTMVDAVGRARAGGGPTFVEALTYRLRGHYEGDPGKYRELSALQDWQDKDPVLRYRTALVAAGRLDRSEADGIEARARQIVEDAAAAAVADPDPRPESMAEGVYA
jgi:pyruvate dehydrogenase E1 component alpha subunit